MNIVILGVGLVGFQLARQLVDEGKRVTLIERDVAEARRAADRLDCRVITGEGGNLDNLRQAGIEQADFFVSVTESDEINMIACGLVAAEYSEPVTVARVRNVDYSMSRMVQRRLYGVDHVINPEIEAAKAVVRALERGAIGTVNPFGETGLSMISLSIKPESLLVDRSIREIRSSLDNDFILPLIIRGSVSLIPTGETRIFADDQIYVISDAAGTDALMVSAGLKHREIKRIAIAGGGRIGRYVVDYLLSGDGDDIFHGLRWKKRFRKRKNNRKIHYIERDYESGRELAEAYPQALVTHADISDEEVTEAGLLEGYDLLISATGNQELNLVASIHAKNHGVKRTIALVRKSSYISMAREMGVDVTVSVTNTMVDSILSILRKGDVRGVHSIAGSDFEIIDFVLDDDSFMAGKTIAEVEFPRNSLILLVSRGEESLLPRGDLLVLAGDRVMLITSRVGIKRLEEVIIGS